MHEPSPSCRLNFIRRQIYRHCCLKIGCIWSISADLSQINYIDDIVLSCDVNNGFPYGESRTDTYEHETGRGYLVEGDYYIRPTPEF